MASPSPSEAHTFSRFASTRRVVANDGSFHAREFFWDPPREKTNHGRLRCTLTASRIPRQMEPITSCYRGRPKGVFDSVDADRLVAVVHRWRSSYRRAIGRELSRFLKPAYFMQMTNETQQDAWSLDEDDRRDAAHRGGRANGRERSSPATMRICEVSLVICVKCAGEQRKPGEPIALAYHDG